MNKALIKVLTLTALLPMATIVQADMKPYIEGQIIYSSPDDASTNTYSATSGGVTFTGVKFENEYDSEISAGLEFGLRLNESSRIGLSYTKADFEFESQTLSGSVTIDGTTYTGSIPITRADYGSDASSWDNDAKLYLANYYYDFNAGQTLRPFLGIGFGIADIQNAKDKEFAYAGHAGAKYYFNDNAYIGGKFTYARVNGITDGWGIDYEDIDFYSGTLAVGFEF